MAVTFLQKKKIQRSLVLILGVVVFVTAGVLWWGFFSKTQVPKESGIPPQEKIEVNISVLESPILELLDKPRGKTVIPPNVGRDNPFLPSL